MTSEMTSRIRSVFYTLVFCWAFCHKVHGTYTDSNILAHYRLNGSDTGVRNIGAVFADGRYPGSKAVHFRQSNSYLFTPIVAINQKNFTIACWIKIAFFRKHRQSIYGGWKPQWQFQYIVSSTGKLTFLRHIKSDRFDSWGISGGNIPVKQWSHVAVTWKQQEGFTQLHVDAVEVNRKSFRRSDRFYGHSADSEYLIGNVGYRIKEDRQFYGAMSDLYVLDVALSPDELNRLRGFPIINTSLIPVAVTLYENENKVLKCRAEGLPSPNVTWLHNGHIVNNGTSVATLKIPKAGKKHEGSYKCVASNMLGETSKVVNITVVGPFALCTKYSTIDDVTRSINHPFQGSVIAETVDNQIWYRLSGNAGTQLPPRCVPVNRCGARAPGWLNGNYPDVKDGIVQRNVCFHLNGDCCGYETTVQIRKCFEGFYVHKFESLPSSIPGRYCATAYEGKEAVYKSTPIYISTLDTVGFALKGHVMYTEKHVADPALCMSYCNLVEQCDSFNFSPQHHVCELNDATKDSHDADYKPDASFIYYEKVGHSVKVGEDWCGQ